MDKTPPTAVTAIGLAASSLRLTVTQFERLARDLGIQPAMKLDGVLRFNDQDIERIAERLRQTGATVADDRLSTR